MIYLDGMHCVTNDERTLMGILDRYKIKYERETRLFALELTQNAQKVHRALCPDFYLPKWDVYVELGPMRPPEDARRRNYRFAMQKMEKIRMVRNTYPFAKIRYLCPQDVINLTTIKPYANVVDFLLLDYDAPLPLAYDFRDQMRVAAPFRKLTDEVYALATAWEEAKTGGKYEETDRLEGEIIAHGWCIMRQNDKDHLRILYQADEVTSEMRYCQWRDGDEAPFNPVY